MKILKPLLFAVAMALLPLSLSAADETVVLQLSNGQKVEFAFTDNPVIVTGPEQLVMRSAKGDVSYNYDAVQSITWSKTVSPTGISTVKADGATTVAFRMTDNGIEVTGLAKGETVSVYTVSGMQVAAVKSNGGTANVALPGGKGIYVIHTTSGISYKFIRK